VLRAAAAGLGKFWKSINFSSVGVADGVVGADSCELFCESPFGEPLAFLLSPFESINAKFKFY